MLKECLEVFKADLETNRKKIIDRYVPADGTYIIVSPKGESFEIKSSVEIKWDKKNKELIGRTNSEFKNICYYDYYSKIFGTNKVMDGGSRIIQSNNYLSFIINRESLTNGKLTEVIIDKYYEVLKNPIIKYEGSKQSKELYNYINDKIGDVNVEELDKIRNWIKNNIFNLDIENKSKYLKVFFEYPIDKYIDEGKRYFIPNIYNKNKYNVNINDNIYGLHNNNISLNDKKIYVENKTRKVPTPYLISIDEAIIQKEFFDYLYNEVSTGKYNVFINTYTKKIEIFENGKMPEEMFVGFFLRIKKGMSEAEILDYDTISLFNPNLSKPFYLKNMLDLDIDKYPNHQYGKYTKTNEMQRLINEILFRKYLISNFFTNSSEIPIKDDNVLRESIILSRNVIYNWLYKGINHGFLSMIDNISLKLIKNSINRGFVSSALYQFNFRWSIIEYLKGGEGMADLIKDVKSELSIKINSNVTKEIENDKEYYFAVGQLVNYLLSLSKSKNKNQSQVNQFINCKNNDDLSDRLRKLYKKYSYNIEQKSNRFNNLYSMIIGYSSENKVDQDMIIAGYLNSSLIYEKNKGEN